MQFINECSAYTFTAPVPAGGTTYAGSKAVYRPIRLTLRVAISGTMAVLTRTFTALACVGAKEEIRRVKHNSVVTDFGIELSAIIRDLDDCLDSAKKREIVD